MSEPGVPKEATTPMVTCRVCGTEVPAGAFCGFCGASLSRQPGSDPNWLRAHTYSAASGEHLLRLSVVSSIFPHLAHRSRAAFRMGFAGLILLMIVLALLRWQVPLVAVSSLGFALLFLIYLEESDVYGDDDLPVGTLLLTAGLGIALGVGWALWSGPRVARSYLSFNGLSSPTTQLYALAIPTATVVLMLVPAVLIRLTRPRHLESLDGFLIGSLGAVTFSAAGTLTRLVPQLASGPVADKRLVSDLLVEAGIRGVAAPLTAAAAGGIVGAALWLATGTQRPQRRKGIGAGFVLALALVLMIYAALGLVDAARLWPPLQLLLHLLIAAVAILGLRIAVHLALLHEAHAQIRTDHILCAECHHDVPHMAFCPNCGTATRASSRSSRKKRRLQVEPADSQAVHPAAHTSHRRLLIVLGASLTVLVAAMVLVAWLITPAIPLIHCRHPGCGHPPTKPPIGPIQPIQPPELPNLSSAGLPDRDLEPNRPVRPVQTGARFTGQNGLWSVEYPAQLGAVPPGRGVAWESTRDGSHVALFGLAAGDRTAQDIAEILIEDNFPGAAMAYTISNAMVGYQHGYGVIKDFTTLSGAAQFARGRVLAIVAIKNGLALGVLASGPYHRFVPPEPDGHPSGADLIVAAILGPYVNSFMWNGDPPR